MAWGKYVIIPLGLMLITHVAHASGIETFTDSQGILHITNRGAAKPKNPENLSNPAAPLYPGNVPGKAPVTPPVGARAPEVQAPAAKPGAAPVQTIPVAPQRGSRVTHTEGSRGVMQVAHRTRGQEEPGTAAGATRASLEQVSWSQPRPVKPVPNGKITMYRDRQGVIHITNLLQEGEEPAAPVAPAPVVQTLPPEVAVPAVRTVSCPELGVEVANYLEDKLRALAPAMTGQTIRRYRDRRGVLNIVNEPSPDPALPQARFAASTGQITAPASVQGPPVTPMPPAMAWGPGFVKPPPGAADQKVVARRDRRGILHIFTCASPGAMPDQGSPLHFLGKVPPAVQACIIEGAQQYGLPVSLVLALIQKESNFTHQAVSPKGAMGLMQLMPGTAASLGVRDPFDPRENILAGCRYFRTLLDYFQGNVPLALAGYNAGSHRVISAGFQVPAIKETQEFVTQVMGLYYLLEKRTDSL
jgi:soluble lytic murein transglycosylase-like protein